MSSNNFVRVPKHLLKLAANFRRGMISGANRAKLTLENGVKTSIHKRWHKTGASELAAKGKVENVKGGNVKVVVEGGQPYDVFGEYGTGEKGAAAAPSFRPSSWNYGQRAGIAPRMAFHLGAEEVLDDVIKDFETAFSDKLSGK